MKTPNILQVNILNYYKKYYIKYLYNQKEKASYEYDIFKKNTIENLFTQNKVEEICLGPKKRILEEEDIFKKIFVIVVAIAIVAFLLFISLLILDKKRNKFLINK